MSDELKYRQSQMVFIRGRICNHTSKVDGIRENNEWLIVPVDSKGNDVQSGGVLFVAEASIVSIAEAKTIVRMATA